MERKETSRFIPDGSEPEPEPLADAMRLVQLLRRDIRKAAKSMEVLCQIPACAEWARFRTDAEALLCPPHARDAQRQHGVKLWHYAQPKVVYDLYGALMRYTAVERRERRDEALARIKEKSARGYTLEELEYTMGKDLAVEGGWPGEPPVVAKEP